MFEQNGIKREKSIISDLFYLRFINIFKCKKCSNETYQMQKFFDLSLIIPPPCIKKLHF